MSPTVLHTDFVLASNCSDAKLDVGLLSRTFEPFFRLGCCSVAIYVQAKLLGTFAVCHSTDIGTGRPALVRRLAVLSIAFRTVRVILVNLLISAGTSRKQRQLVAVSFLKL
jgi:hypothetical protein